MMIKTSEVLWILW